MRSNLVGDSITDRLHQIRWISADIVLRSPSLDVHVCRHMESASDSSGEEM